MKKATATLTGGGIGAIIGSSVDLQLWELLSPERYLSSIYRLSGCR